jgi:hypothetical protein
MSFRGRLALLRRQSALEAPRIIDKFADLCTYVYVVTDGVYREVGTPNDTYPGLRSGFTEGELLTVSLVAELVGVDAEMHCLAYPQRNHPALGPLLREYSRFNHCHCQSAEVNNRSRAAILALMRRALEAEGADLCLIDSVPVPVVGFYHPRHGHRWYREADYGWVATERQTIYGPILNFALAGRQADGALAEQLLIDKAGLTALGDKGYINGP